MAMLRCCLPSTSCLHPASRLMQGLASTPAARSHHHQHAACSCFLRALQRIPGPCSSSSSSSSRHANQRQLGRHTAFQPPHAHLCPRTSLLNTAIASGQGTGPPCTSGRGISTSQLCQPTARHQQQQQQRRGHVLCRAASGSASAPSDPGDGKQEGGGGKQSLLTLPTLLTLARVAAIPLLVAAWYWPSPWSAPVCTSIFVLAALTDWLDGYLARKMNLFSSFGAFLDPVADKLMVAAALILLCTQPIAAGPLAGNNWLMPVMTLAIIGREITMSALREWAATLGPEAREAVAVNAWGKWKTACQMTSLTLLLAMRGGGSCPLIDVAGVAGPALLCVAAYLTVWSLALYFRGLWRYMV